MHNDGDSTQPALREPFHVSMSLPYPSMNHGKSFSFRDDGVGGELATWAVGLDEGL